MPDFLVAPPLWDRLPSYKRVPFPDDYDSNIRTFFSPGDDCHGVLLALIQSATTSLLISMYGEDDPELTAAVLETAKNPNVYVQVNLDSTQAAGRSEVPLVQQLRGCPLTRVAVGQSANHKINHLKMIVADGLYVAGGSMNWSSDGEGVGGKGQNNELVIRRSRAEAHMATIKLNTDHETMLAQMAAHKAA